MDEALTLGKVISLAAVDAINPCALAVLTMMLISIITANPQKKLNIIWAGLAFTFSVFIMYLAYGFLIIKAFSLIQAISSIRIFLYQGLGAAAVILGILQLKDFFFYKQGSFTTEMPLFLRPKVAEVIYKITSPVGAFGVGAFVTLFLLPCTIGPYIILGGMLSVMDFIKTLPWLLVYNFIFVLPMLAITFAVYFGVSKIEDISCWKDKNVRYLHLTSGLIIFTLGLSMLMGWV